MAVVSFHNVEEGLEMCDLEYEMCKEMEDQMVMVDNITSCNVVDNYLWLDEYKQNNNNITLIPSNTSNKRIMTMWRAPDNLSYTPTVQAITAQSF